MEAKNVKIYKELNLNYKPQSFALVSDFLEPLNLSEFLDYENQATKIISLQSSKEYAVVLTFINSRNNLNYVVFMEENNIENDKYKFYSAIYDEDAPEPFIGYPNSVEEYEDIYNLLKNLFC